MVKFSGLEHPAATPALNRRNGKSCGCNSGFYELCQHQVVSWGSQRRPDGQSAGSETDSVGRADQCPSQLQGSSVNVDDYITYGEMQELQRSIGELLHSARGFLHQLRGQAGETQS